MIAGLTGLSAVFLYYLVVWVKVGRRLPAGAIMPIYEPPQGMSPAAMRYLQHMGLDGIGLTACILDLAAKDYLKIEQDDSRVYWLVRRPKFVDMESWLSSEEKVLGRKLFESRSRFALCDENSAELGAAREALASALHVSMEKIYFVSNVDYLWPGVLLTMATIGLLLFLGIGGVGAVFFLPIFLGAWTLGTYDVFRSAVRAWRTLSAKGLGGPSRAIFMTLFSIPMLVGEMLALIMLFGLTSGSGFLVTVALLFVNVLFYHLVKTPTRVGRQLLDRIEGFKMFLSTVEGERLNAQTPRGKTPEDFERLLPYAVALGVEHGWSQKFAHVLAAATGLPEANRGYSLSWYDGPSAGSSPSALASSFASALSEAVSSSATPAKSAKAQKNP